MSHCSVHDQLRLALQASDLSEWELARRADVSLALVEQVLGGGGDARVDMLVQIAGVLDLELTLRPKEPEPRIMGSIPTVVDAALMRMRPAHVVQVIDPTSNVLALDLEGTLISDTVSMVARPGLFKFLTYCRPLFQRIVMFTNIEESLFRRIASRLVDEGSAPHWFADIECVGWTDLTKDLTLVRDTDVGQVMLVDDSPLAVQPGQHLCWVPIKCYERPFEQDDCEFDRVLDELVRRDFQASGWACR
jgi:hypothetical protein